MKYELPEVNIDNAKVNFEQVVSKFMLDTIRYVQLTEFLHTDFSQFKVDTESPSQANIQSHEQLLRYLIAFERISSFYKLMTTKYASIYEIDKAEQSANLIRINEYKFQLQLKFYRGNLVCKELCKHELTEHVEDLHRYNYHHDEHHYNQYCQICGKQLN